MTELSPPPRRRKLNHEVAARRKAVHLLRPFLDKFEGWYAQAARHSANLLSEFTDSEQKAASLQAMRDLREEVAEQYGQFTPLSEGHRHSRVDDVRHAFERLLSMIDAAVG